MKKKSLTKLIIQRQDRPRGKKKYDVQMYAIERFKTWESALKKLVKRFKVIKFEIKLVTKLQKREKEDEYIYSQPCFRSTAVTILSPQSTEELLREALAQILDAYDVYMKQGSGWLLHHISFSQINVYRYETRGGGGGVMGLRKNLLPEVLVRNYKSVLCLHPSADKKCFLHCVLAALYPLPKEKNKKKTDPREYLQHEHRLNTQSLTYPVTIQQIPKFERDNGLCINVQGYSDKKRKLFYHYFSKNMKNSRRINLLLYKKHFNVITSFGCLLNYEKTNKRTLCQSCARYVLKTKGLICLACKKRGLSEGEREETSMPNLEFSEPGSKQKFTNFKKMKDHPFVYYCDLETMLVDVAEEEGKKLKKKKIHQPISIGYLRVCSSRKKFSQKKPVIHTGKNCVEKFYKSLKEEIIFMDRILEKNYPLDISEEENRQYEAAKTCYICEKHLEEEEKMRDHDHLMKRNNYLGAICNGCNLNRTDIKKSQTPLIFHNGGKFDIHFLIQKLHILDQPVTRLIGKTGENIMSMDLFMGRLVVIDSLNHLSSSLASLVEIMCKSGKPLQYTARSLRGDEKGLQLLSRKGVFPYEYVTSHQKLIETEELPPEKEFYDNLNERSITSEDYTHAQKVWDHFHCQNLQEYMEVYLRSDITLLADVFENYRKFFREKFQLDAARYLSLPGLSYDCMMKHTKCKLDYIYDQETYDFLRKGLRGGVSMIPHRYVEANNPQLKNYDSSKDTTFLVYLDANALYSSIMTLSLPYKNLRWVEMERKEAKKIITDYTNRDKVGYFFECDLDYPPNIHDLTKDLPLAPERCLVTEDMLSPFTKKLQEKFGVKADKVSKLLSTQYKKKKYVCHVENLQFYLRKGMKLLKVHRVLQFRQKSLFKDYITLCIEERNKPGVSADEKSMWKLCCNSIFGKTIQNMEKRNNIVLLSDHKKVLNAIASPRFKHADLITPEIAQISSFKRKQLVTTPYYIGVTILELSKLHMMRIHYDHFVKKFGRSNIQLCMTDTDSLLYEIKTENLDQDLREIGIVEFTNYPEEHPSHEEGAGGKLFYLKDESAGRPIKSFVGLRAKSYSIAHDDSEKNKTVGKGIPKAKLRGITHEDMKRVLVESSTTEITSNQLRSFKHEMFSIQQKKVALSPLDNKRYLCDDGIHTLPYGHRETLGEKRN